MSPKQVDGAVWDGYQVSPRHGAQLTEHEDGSLELQAESEYLVTLPASAEEPAHQALEVLAPGLALVRFGNFIGESSLGGRRLLVTSNRLQPPELEAMLDDVVSALHSLPFFFETPTQRAYARDVLSTDDVDYQAYAFVSHALRGIGEHDLPSARDRILARPHSRLVATRADVPLARADRVDAETVASLASGHSPLHQLPPLSPLAGSPIGLALGGRAPASVRAQRMTETTNTSENQFVVAVLAIAAAIIERFRAAVRRSYPLRAERHLRESDELLALLGRWRRHPALASVQPAQRMAIESTVLRGRPGYRQVTRFFVDLQARTRLLDEADARQLLEVRDAALIYEYWCYFQVVEAAARALGRQPSPTRFRHGSFGSNLDRAFATELGSARVVFNLQFSRSAKFRSYSVPLRPDITLELEDGTRHLFDAKFKREPIPPASVPDVELEQEEQRATYRRGDLYKMHTYRDAIGAQSVWVIFPGRDVPVVNYRPEGPPEQPNAAVNPCGVGAIPLLPGREADALALEQLIRTMIEAPATESGESHG